jgi:hypothetical protein
MKQQTEYLKPKILSIAILTTFFYQSATDVFIPALGSELTTNSSLLRPNDSKTTYATRIAVKINFCLKITYSRLL